MAGCPREKLCAVLRVYGGDGRVTGC